MWQRLRTRTHLTSNQLALRPQRSDSAGMRKQIVVRAGDDGVARPPGSGWSSMYPSSVAAVVSLDAPAEAIPRWANDFSCGRAPCGDAATDGDGAYQWLSSRWRQVGPSGCRSNSMDVAGLPSGSAALKFKAAALLVERFSACYRCHRRERRCRRLFLLFRDSPRK